MTKPTRPLALKIDDAMNELVASVERIAERHGLPCYLMEPLVSVVLSRLENGKRKEIDNARMSYETKLAEYETEEETNGKRNSDNR